MCERIETVLQPPMVDSDGDACEVANLSQNPQEHPQRDPQLCSRRILVHHGALRELFRMDVTELARLRGLADAKAVRLNAALGLGRRLAALSPIRPLCALPVPILILLGVGE